MEQRFTFDGVASLYNTSRPLYPDALFADVIDFAGLETKDQVLEIGCGTGQATEGFARRGLSILALDPGAELIAVARERLAGFPRVRFEQTTFEAWPGKLESFRLIFAAQSFHWVTPELRFARAAALLAPEGILAVFGNVPMKPESPLSEKFAGIYARHAPQLTGPPAEAWYLPDGPFVRELQQSDHFEAPAHHCHPWSRLHTAQSYTDLLRTLSSSRLLAEDQRESLLSELADAINAHGGVFELRYETHLYLAKRSGAA
ncbi:MULTISPECIES: class I SAM-dependent methyltransferase [unclassified Rhizobium]|uniref:class I SAM-dependent methyltransferase n=1 Tax=unclassified Rhizobium TaxID=2613769 RepID=UPI000DE18409|nr:MULTISPECIES: class I SAM-dependent methyltransferase [unclassified Rhizobium]MBB3288037.1 SAM-dependent methyltransferase [Rhizobium sp. BK252]MBB3403100.1 SAM-dependent methyltransferase [Rhizobium sp. BK289]MBB3415677.1 SAM-dependent methyltransferase [Rhizobium sp. BK284]MBB3483243.1 SAM-dependent methyltransferase [Rhizobium sp. BK347]MDK4723893.1 class I SAM-dependent methyltransferase [Rhizobium sp. CNPSo 3968]